MANPPPLRCGIWLHHQFKNKNALYEHAAATARRGNRSYIFLDDGFIHTNSAGHRHYGGVRVQHVDASDVVAVSWHCYLLLKDASRSRGK